MQIMFRNRYCCLVYYVNAEFQSTRLLVDGTDKCLGFGYFLILFIKKRLSCSSAIKKYETGSVYALDFVQIDSFLYFPTEQKNPGFPSHYSMHKLRCTSTIRASTVKKRLDFKIFSPPLLLH